MKRISLLTLTVFLVSAAPGAADDPKTEGLEGRGVVVPVKRVTITSAVAGQVSDVLVQTGQQVKRGSVLVRLESVSQELDIKKAELQLRTARVRLDQLRDGTREDGLKIARAEVALAEATLKQAEGTLERLRKLRASGAVSAEEVTQGEGAVRTAQAQVERQRAAFRAAEKKDETESARIGVEAAHVELERAKAALDSRTVRAPFDGIILDVGAEVGSFTNPAAIGLANASSLCELADLSAALVEVVLPESAFGQVALGTKCEAILTVVRGKKLQGVVTRISPAIDPARNTFTVRVKLTTTEPLPMGASAQVRFATKQ